MIFVNCRAAQTLAPESLRDSLKYVPSRRVVYADLLSPAYLLRPAYGGSIVVLFNASLTTLLTLRLLDRSIVAVRL